MDDAKPETDLHTVTTAAPSPSSPPDDAYGLSQKGLHLTEKAVRSGDPQDFSGAIATLQRAVDLVEQDDQKPYYLIKLGDALEARFERLGSPADLDEAISLKRRAVSLTPDGHASTAARLSMLGIAVATRFEYFDRLKDLNEAVELQMRALGLTPEGDPQHTTYTNNLAMTLEMRYKRLGAPSDVDKAIELKQKSVDLTPDAHPSKPIYLANLGVALQLRFYRTGNTDDLGSIITLERRAADLTPDEHADKPRRLSNLGSTLGTRFHFLGDVRDLEESVSLQRRAVELTPSTHPALPGYLDGLGNALQLRFERHGELSDLDESISLKQRALALVPDGHPRKPSLSNNLANAFRLRFARFSDPADLETAITLVSAAADLTPSTNVNDKAAYLANLAGILNVRFDRLGNDEDLERAVQCIRSAVEIAPDGGPHKPGYLSNLGLVLEARFQRLGKLEDLDEAIAAQRRAVDLIPSDHGNPHRRLALNNLANALQTRFRRLRELEDIESVIRFRKEVLDATSDGDLDKPGFTVNLGNAYQVRFNQLGDVADLEAAVELKKRAVELTPVGHAEEAGRRSALGTALAARYKLLKRVEDIDAAVDAQERAISLLPDGHPWLPPYLNFLGLNLASRFDRLRDAADLERAIECMRRGIALVPDGHPDKAQLLIHCADTLHARFTLTSDPAHFTETFLALLDAVGQSGPPLPRLRAAKHCAEWTYLDAGAPFRDRLLEIHERALALIPQVAWLGQNISRRYHELLSEVGGIVNGAAAAAIAAGDLGRAVEWLEEGRGVVWSQLLRLRTPVDALRDAHPDLAAELQGVSRALEDAGNVDDDAGSGAVAVDAISHRTKMAEWYEQLLDSIRAKDGFERFLRPKNLAELAPACAAASGPVVFVNVYETRCDALAFCAADRIVHVPLPGLTQKLAESMRAKMAESLNRVGVRERAARSSVRVKGEDGMVRVLGLLWSHVVRPVLEALENEPSYRTSSSDGLPHVTWCATGALAFLPLHAAGDYTTQAGPRAFNRVVSSYTPSLSALIQPSSLSSSSSDPRPVDNFRSAHVLLVSTSAVPGFPPLPGVQEEVDAIKEQFPLSRVSHLSDENATVQAVLDAMGDRSSRIVHLACHGIQDAYDPTKSAFVLHGGALELSKLMSRSAGDAALAVLSACQTAKGDAQLPEEAVHLAAGMLAVGYKAVIGTMWSIGDSDAPLVTRELYSFLRRDAETSEGDKRLRSAYALHEAVKKLREDVGEQEFVRWVPFVHFGS